MLHLDNHIQSGKKKKKKDVFLDWIFLFWGLMWEIEVWHLSVVACFKRVWSPLSAAEAFGSTLKHLQWVKLGGKDDFSPLLFSLHCLLLCDDGREELFKGTSRWILDGYTPPFFSHNFCQHRDDSTGNYKDKFHYNINVLSLLISWTPPTPVTLITDSNLALQLSQLQMEP